MSPVSTPLAKHSPRNYEYQRVTGVLVPQKMSRVSGAYEARGGYLLSDLTSSYVSNRAFIFSEEIIPTHYFVLLKSFIEHLLRVRHSA